MARASASASCRTKAFIRRFSGRREARMATGAAIGNRYRAEPEKKIARAPAKKIPIHANRKEVSGSRRLRHAATAAAGTRVGNTIHHEWMNSIKAFWSLFAIAWKA